MWFFIVGSLYAAMLRVAVLARWAAALAVAAVLPTESGDAFYFAFGGQAGAVNAYGQRLWEVPGELIASDPMGSCLAAAHRVFNGTLFLVTAVTLYTADGRFLWSTVVNINATALATNCVEAAIGVIYCRVAAPSGERLAALRFRLKANCVSEPCNRLQEQIAVGLLYANT
jgi:hypothetical protein